MFEDSVDRVWEVLRNSLLVGENKVMKIVCVYVLGVGRNKVSGNDYR